MYKTINTMGNDEKSMMLAIAISNSRLFNGIRSTQFNIRRQATVTFVTIVKVRVIN